MARTSLEERLKTVPAHPGVYIMRDGEGKVLYVGKASLLRHRLAWYFGTPKDPSVKLTKFHGPGPHIIDLSKPAESWR